MSDPGAQRLHWYILAAEGLPEGGATPQTRRVSVYVSSPLPRLPRRAIDGAIMRAGLAVADTVVLAVSYLGQMTASEFDQ